MMAQYGAYADTFDGDTNPWPSAVLWSHIDAENERPGRWFGSFEDFIDHPVVEPTTQDNWGLYRMFTSSGGTFTSADAEGGVGVLTEATDNEGVAIAQGFQPFKLIQDAGELAFEARFKVNTIADTKSATLVGLIDSTAMTVDIPLANAATADLNLVGFYRDEADGDKLDTVYTANGVTTVEVAADAVTLVADTFVKVGMTFNRAADGRDNILRFWKDGIQLADTKAIPSAAGTDFPNDVRMGWVIAQRLAASASATTSVDWVKCYQKRVATTIA